MKSQRSEIICLVINNTTQSVNTLALFAGDSEHIATNVAMWLTIFVIFLLVMARPAIGRYVDIMLQKLAQDCITAQPIIQNGQNSGMTAVLGWSCKMFYPTRLDKWKN